jgi:hypothetical protein
MSTWDTTADRRPGVCVVEKSPFIRSVFLGLGSKLPGLLYMHRDVLDALSLMKNQRLGHLFLSRKALAESPEGDVMVLSNVVQRDGLKVTVMYNRAETPDLPGPVPLPVAWFLLTPFPPSAISSIVAGMALDASVATPGPVPAGLVPAAERTPRPLERTPRPVDRTPRPADRTPRPADWTPRPVDSTPRPGPPLAVRDPILSADLDALDHFQVLGVTRAATNKDLLNAYLERVKRFHPDAIPPSVDPRLAQQMRAVFRRVTEAWHVLGDETRRLKYASQG